MSGKLEAIVGPMYSGKSGDLANKLDTYRYRDEKALGIQPVTNDRDEKIESRDGRHFDAIKVASLGDVSVRELVKYQAIGVDELFMFPASDAQYIYEWLKLERNVYVSTLDVLANGRIPDIYQRVLTLGPIITKKTAICHFCSSDATHTTAMLDGVRVYPESDINVQDSAGSPDYFASCLDHFDPGTNTVRSLLEK